MRSSQKCACLGIDNTIKKDADVHLARVAVRKLMAVGMVMLQLLTGRDKKSNLFDKRSFVSVENILRTSVCPP